jgi:hypothetical protein
MGDDSHVVFSKKIPDKKGSMRKCVVMQQPVLLSPKFGEQFLAFFMQSP